MRESYVLKIILLIACLLLGNLTQAQTTYGSTGTYGLRLVSPTYTGSAIQVRRSCDNATKDIGFSCGALNTAALNAFVGASNPVSVISTAPAASFALRKLTCGLATNLINVRRSSDNLTKDIGFIALGDLDTTALKTFVLASSPLNVVSAASAAAYSLRKLKTAYAGKAINVRRSSDNTTSDIGFTALGDLDTATLKTFVGAGNGFVTEWYDQSGNGNNAVQATTTSQPEIVIAGVVNRQNGMPAMVFSTALASYLTIPYAAATMNFSSASTCNAVLARTAAAGNTCDAVFCQQYTGGNISMALSWNSLPAPGTTLAYGFYPGGWQNAELATDVALNTNNIITGTILSGAANTTAINLYQNGTLQTAMANQTTLGAQSGLGFNIGKRWDLANYAPMNCQEIIVFASVLSTTDRQYLELSQSLYYAISGGPSYVTTFPAGTPSAFVTEWYDQSGNGRNVTQATTANQPRILNAGVIDRQNGLPAMRYIGTSNMYLAMPQTSVFALADSYVIGSADVATNASSWWGAYRTGGNTGGANRSLANGESPTISGFSLWSDWGGYAVDSVYVDQITSNTTIASRHNLTSATLSQVTTRQLAPVAAATYASTGISFGGDAQSTYGALTGYLNELVFFSTALSQTDKAYMQWSQASYYGISGVTVATLPAAAPSGYITKWYDQSGNGNNLLQATNANQPKIVNTGTINLQGSLPTVPLDGVNYYMSQTTMSIANPYSLNAITTRTANGGNGGSQRLISMSATLDDVGYFGVLNGAYQTSVGNGTTWNDVTANTAATTTVALNTQTILSAAIATGATGLSPFINGTAQATKNGTAATATGFVVGATYAGNTNELWTGNISEVNIFPIALNTTRRTLLETNQGAYFGLTPSNSKYTPASGYNLFVSGIGRTNATDSVADSRVSIGMGIITNTTVTDFLKDNGDYITIGTTCPTAAVSTSLNMPTGATAGYERWSNDWYLNKTDINTNGGNVQLFFDFSDYGVAGVPVTASNYQLWGRANTASNFTVVPTTGVSISGDRVVFTLNATSLGTTGYYTIGTVDYQNSPLPIELLSFMAVPDGDKVDVAWETITETNNAYFTIEKSKDGINFTKVIDVPGAGNSTNYKNYAEVDYQPYEGTSYYRLKQTDKNGAYKYFTMVPVNFTAQKNITVYPNPITNTTNFNVKVNGYPNQQVIVVLRDVQGREFVSKVLLTVEGNEVFMVEETKLLPPGAYIITATSNDKIYNYKVIVR
jgi:hypothetical protein